MKDKLLFFIGLFLFSCSLYAQPYANDLGIVSITSPYTGPASDMATVSVLIRNFGTDSQSNFPVSYTLNSGNPVTESFPGTIEPGEELYFDFATAVNLIVPGSYFVVVRTELANDEDVSNDANGINVESLCTPLALEGCWVDGIKRFVLNTIDLDDGENGCNTEPSTSPDGYADRKNFSTILFNNDGYNVYTLQAQQNWENGGGVERLSAWIDFNDDTVFEVSERLISGEYFQSFEVLEDFVLTIPLDAVAGPHVLRVLAMDSSGPGDVLDPCDNYGWGETQDYTVIIDTFLGVEDEVLSNSDIKVISLEDGVFEVNVLSSSLERLDLAVYNMNGQLIKSERLYKTDIGYNSSIDMSGNSTGVYLLKISSVSQSNFGTAKIIVN